LKTALEADRPALIDVVNDEACKPEWEHAY
jgi:hypothetical protein